MKEFKDAIRQALKQRKLSMAKVSIDAGMSDSALKKILNDEKDIAPTLDNVINIADVLGLKFGLIDRNQYFNESILRDVIINTLKYARRFSQDVAPEEYAHTIIEAYKEDINKNSSSS